MKPKQLLIAGTIACTIAFTACRKEMQDYQLMPAEVASDITDATTTTTCHVTFISGTYEYEPDQLTIRYNAAGNPISVKSAQGPATGRPDLLFRYDAQNRLTDCIGVYSNGNGFESWSKYKYDRKNRIVYDTAFIFGQLGERPTHFMFKHVTHYTYDDQNRIIKASLVWKKPSDGGGFEEIFNYDGNGNLVTGQSYDNKKNIHRTHPVFAFIDRDYSVNNPQHATTYHHGLPTSLYVNPNADYPRGEFKFLQFGLTDSISIKYRCN